MSCEQENILAENKDTEEKQTDTTPNCFYRFVSFVGFETIDIIKKAVDSCRKLFHTAYTRLNAPLGRFGSRAAVCAKRIGRSAARPFYTIGHGFTVLRQNTAQARQENRSAFAAAGRTLAIGAKRNKWFFKGILNYSAAAVGIAAVCTVVVIAGSIHVAVAVEYDGCQLGYIESEAVYETASRMLRQRIVATDEIPEFAAPKFTLAVVSDTKLTDEDKLADDLLRSSASDIFEAKGVYIGGEFYGAVVDAAPIEQKVEEILAKYRTGAAGEVVALVKPVTFQEGVFLKKSVIEPEEIVTLLGSEVAGETSYIVQAGDTPSGVAEKNNVSYAEFKAMNPNCETTFLIGSKMYLSKSVPFAEVKVTRRETYRQEIMYKTETVNDSSKSISYMQVTQNGQKGINEITADVEYINGVETGRKTVATKVIQNVVNQKIVKGTKAPVKASAAAKSNTGSASLGSFHFMWPVNGGQISSYWGDGRGHKGLDIRAPRGTSTYAAESGTVSLARWYSGYGYCVIIDHGNGVSTLYGHASKLLVTAGQKVSKGDVISLVGSTGDSSGNHCHFEIRTGGTRINPLPYIGK